MIAHRMFEEILQSCCDYSEVSIDHVKSRSRTRVLTNTRAVAVNIFRIINPKISTTMIGAFINRDHSSIIYYLKNHEDLLGHDKEYKDIYNNVMMLFEDKMAGYNDKISPFENLMYKYKTKAERLNKLEEEYSSLLSKYNQIKSFINT